MRFPTDRCRLALALFAALFGFAPCASAATYAVGSGAGCTHDTLQAALTAAASNASGPHLIKLSTGTLAVPNGVTLHSPQADITLEGGYASCSAAAATAGQRTTLNATGGNDGTVLDIRSNSFRAVRLSRLVVTGGTGETGIFASSEGGGLELRGDLDVFLDQGTQVSGNRANRAAGVLMEGGPGYVRLWIGPGAQIRDNIADTDGGGVWCWNLGFIEMVDSSVSFNEAGRDGGGLWMGNRCRLKVAATTGNISQFNSNVAGTRFSGAGEGRGGAVFYRSSEPFAATGLVIDIGEVSATAGNTFVVNNVARNQGYSADTGSGGGAFYLEGRAAQRVAMRIRDSLFVGNATTDGAAISLNRSINLTVEGRSARCSGTFGIGWCSAFFDHRAADIWSLISIEPLGVSTADLLPQLTLRRVRFTDNDVSRLNFDIDPPPLSGPQARVAIESSLIDGNTVSTLMSRYGDTDFRFNTVVGNTVPNNYLFEMQTLLPRTLRVDLHGSLI
jgi:hypothetical protein